MLKKRSWFISLIIQGFTKISSLTCFLLFEYLIRPYYLSNVKDDKSPELAAAIAEEILAYLRANEGAGDTSEGIWRWWLTETREKVDVPMVEEVLQQFTRKGKIGMRVLASGALLYFGLGAKSQGKRKQ